MVKHPSRCWASWDRLSGMRIYEYTTYGVNGKRGEEERGGEEEFTYRRRCRREGV